MANWQFSLLAGYLSFILANQEIGRSHGGFLFLNTLGLFWCAYGAVSIIMGW